MNLSDLNLNRFLYRDSSQQSDSSLTSSNAGITDFSGGAGNGGVPEPGSIITSVILQSSPSDDRIEINPDDTFKAYNGGEVVVLIDKNGITVDNAVVVFTTIEEAYIDYAEITELVGDLAAFNELTVNDSFVYAGVKQPQVFSGEINGTTGYFVGAVPTTPNSPFIWGALRISDGLYIIAHYLANTNYDVTVTPGTGHFRGRVYSKIAGSFLVSFQQTVYGSDTFSVSGGGGGSVTVDGIRISPFEEPVDTDFNFVLINNLP